MNQLYEYIDRLNPTFKYLQFSQPDNWLHAKKFSSKQVHKPLPKDALDKIDKEAVLEFFFEVSNHRSLFLGFKYSPELAKVNDPKEFVSQLYSLAATVKTPTQLLLQAGNVLNGNPSTFINRKVDRAVEFVLDYWTVVGVKRLWKNGEKPIDSKGILRKIESNHQLLKTTKNPLVLEIDYGAPGLWIGIEVSEKNGETYSLQTDFVLALLELIETEE